jgi:hypothetical protein
MEASEAATAEVEDTGTNPYLVLRAAKIARNQARLKELGLWKPPIETTTTKSIIRKRKLTDSSNAQLVGPPRRSTRISKLSDKPNYVGSTIVDERKRTPRALNHSLSSDHHKEEGGQKQNSSAVLATHDFLSVATIRKSLSSKSSSRPSAPPAANSVRSVSLYPVKLVEHFLGKSIKGTGKESVIQAAFRQAAYPEDLQRLEGSPRLSFNKYSGVQFWANVAFLWINLGGKSVGGGTNNSSTDVAVNEFLEDGKLVTWFGGSRMDENCPAIQTLIQWGQQSASSPLPSSGIFLFSRRYNEDAKKYSSYVCLGRLAYHSHVPGSYPVAFTWRLLDYDSFMNTSKTKDTFQQMIRVP